MVVDRTDRPDKPASMFDDPSAKLQVLEYAIEVVVQLLGSTRLSVGDVVVGGWVMCVEGVLGERVVRVGVGVGVGGEGGVDGGRVVCSVLFKRAKEKG